MPLATDSHPDPGRLGRESPPTGVAAGSQAPRDGRADAQALLLRQNARESAARTYARSFPIVPVRAEGMTVVGADGRRYLDCLSGAGTLALGHNHPVVREAIQRVIDDVAPLHILDLATPVKDAFTDALFALLPEGLRDRARVHFCSPAGTDAVEAALKLARLATGRRGVLAFNGAYHGMTAGASGASGSVAARTAGTAAGEVFRLPYPHPYRCPFGLGGDDGARIGLRYIAGTLDDPAGGVPPSAAAIVEGVQGEGGVVPAPDFWLRELRRLTAERDILLIADEVQTGVGRTGLPWVMDHAGVVPDILVVSKAVGGGLPLAAIVYRDDLDVWPPGAHTGTFRGDQLALAAGAATLRFVAENALHRRAAEVGHRMLGALRRLADDHPQIGHVRGRGLMIGVELVRPDHVGADGLPQPAPALARAVRAACLRRGLMVELGGRHDAVVRFLPPLTITDEEAAAVIDRFADAVAAAIRGPVAAPAPRRPS